MGVLSVGKHYSRTREIAQALVTLKWLTVGVAYMLASYGERDRASGKALLWRAGQVILWVASTCVVKIR